MKTNGRLLYSILEMLEACQNPETGRIYVPETVASDLFDELNRLHLVEEAAQELAVTITGLVAVTGGHHTVQEIMALCGLAAVSERPATRPRIME